MEPYPFVPLEYERPAPAEQLEASRRFALTHTPSPMGFIRTLLDRPANERAFCIIPVGYPAADCTVPDLERKPLDAILARC